VLNKITWKLSAILKCDNPEVGQCLMYGWNI
jgi:hypothetical protein